MTIAPKAAWLRRRRVAADAGPPAGLGGFVAKVDGPGHGYRRKHVTLGAIDGSGGASPSVLLGRVIADAMDPTKAPSKVQTLAEMSQEKRAEMERLYSRRNR